MVYIISLIGILIEESLPLQIDIYILALSFISYLSSKKQDINIAVVIMVGLIMSLQTDFFVRNLIILLITYFAIKYILKLISYKKISVIPMAIIQTIMYVFLINFNFEFIYLIINFIGCIILNYVYMIIANRQRIRQEGSIYEKKKN